MFESPIMDMAAACIALIVIWVIAFLFFLKLRKFFNIGAKNRDSSESMSMDSLEKIHSSGMISDEEFTKMRRVLLGLPPIGDEKSKKTRPSDDNFDIINNPDKTDNNSNSDIDRI